MVPYFEKFDAPYPLNTHRDFFGHELADSNLKIQAAPPPDEVLEQQIKDRLEALCHIDFFNIKVSVKNREVTLEGFIDDDRLGQHVEKICDNTPYVRAVKNILEVKSGFARSGAEKAL